MKRLPFESIHDLIEKVEKLKIAHRAQNQALIATLNQNGIDHKAISDYGVAIDYAALSAENKALVFNHGQALIDKAFKDVGVTEAIETTESTHISDGLRWLLDDPNADYDHKEYVRENPEAYLHEVIEKDDNLAHGIVIALEHYLDK